MNGFKLDHWWVGLVAAGIAVMAAAKLAPDPKAFVAIGLGLLLFGIGEWMNHPQQSDVVMGMGGRWLVSGHPRSPTFGGTAFSLAGLLLLIGGAGRVAISLFQ